MHEVEVDAIPLARLAALLGPERAREIEERSAQARQLLEGRTVWNVNATATGGGVAEMLQALLAYGRGAGVDTRWLVLSGGPEFFRITKRLHNQLHGASGDGGPLGPAEHELYEKHSPRTCPSSRRWCDPEASCCSTTPRLQGSSVG
jgi:trehalose synthase